MNQNPDRLDYGLGASGRQLLSRMNRSPRGRAVGAVWHLLEITEFRVRLQEGLERGKGELASSSLRSAGGPSITIDIEF